MFRTINMTEFRKKLTRQIRGANKMADHGQKLPYWMLCQHNLDNLNFAAVHRRYYLKLRRQFNNK